MLSYNEIQVIGDYLSSRIRKMLKEDEIKQRAERLLAVTGLGARFPLPVEKVVQHIGYACHFYIPDEDIEDIAGAVNHLNKKIYINQNNTLLQQRLCIARKVGCIVLHGDEQDYICYLQSTDDPKERAADYFAENLLMPETIFKQKWYETKQDRDKLAQFFGVSQLAITNRAYTLHLL